MNAAAILALVTGIVGILPDLIRIIEEVVKSAKGTIDAIKGDVPIGVTPAEKKVANDQVRSLVYDEAVKLADERGICHSENLMNMAIDIFCEKDKDRSDLFKKCGIGPLTADANRFD